MIETDLEMQQRAGGRITFTITKRDALGTVVPYDLSAFALPGNSVVFRRKTSFAGPDPEPTHTTGNGKVTIIDAQQGICAVDTVPGDHPTAGVEWYRLDGIIGTSQRPLAEGNYSVISN